MMNEAKVVNIESARINQIKRKNEANYSVSSDAKGFVMLHRKIKKTSFYKDSEAVHLFIHLLMDASYKPSVISMNGKEIALNRGQVITGRKELCFELGLADGRVKYLLGKLQRHGAIKVDANKHYSIVSIVNYDSYQWSENTENTPVFVPTDCQQSANAKSDTARLGGEVVPTDCQQSATINKLINNISNTIVLDNPIDKQSSLVQDNLLPETENLKKTKTRNPNIDYQAVMDIFNEILPEISIKALDKKRKDLIKTFWDNVTPLNNKLERDVNPSHEDKRFNLDDWTRYLTYISKRCTWMLRDDFNPVTNFARNKKSIEYLLNTSNYLAIREGRKNDRK